ncbi:alpha/beta hydrolase [Leptospira gomenensis]|uniref:Alpha/beta hydrolase n=1 Tax=Leptospira gomenensis TaxID=2484974 RepID=A0A5F1YBN1_9LEPT|nr:alpha/beta hydrolase [Leptospira gomenensis]TGK33821.1 alpha/beta hydrolase [Leptospira gomenensis]TGK42986.1 alpha/beta hydrolase [Leptospira gomenensis]TGK44951.1 alpha/beta hydrolase [Leptospira gomenensis]TGK59905.1 alpha/beta hydrolase [Leptospira gomenensis]
MKKIVSTLRTLFYFLSEIFEFIVSVILSLIPSAKDRNLSRGDIYVVTGFFSGPLFYSKLCSALERQGYQPRILRLPPVFLNTRKAVETLAKQMDEIPPKSVLLAHNTGGLVTLLLPDRSRQKIRGLVTLGTPFRGSHLFWIWPAAGLRYGSAYLKELFKTFLFMDRFHPLAPFREFIFLPASSSVYGEERDLWFDIPGNFNQVRKSENIRTILEFLIHYYPSAASLEAKRAAALSSSATKETSGSKIRKGSKKPVVSGSRKKSAKVQTKTKTRAPSVSAQKKSGAAGKTEKKTSITPAKSKRYPKPLPKKKKKR